MPIHDLQHRLHPDFQEVCADGQWSLREYICGNGIRHAAQILVDSAIGLLDVRDQYNVDINKISIVPHRVTDYISSNDQGDINYNIATIRSLYDLPEKFLFYPAQFWPHKNHCRIVEAIWLARQSGVEVSVVFCGYSEGGVRETAERIKYLSDRFHVSSNVRMLGYVAQEHMCGFYREATGLVMPTFFGPTNIPILEAWASDCPVLTSNIRGIREQVGEAALLIDPRSVNSLADGMMRLWTDSRLQAQLIERGRERLSRFAPRRLQAKIRDVILSVAAEYAAR
jgi:glycosyltransferase involved in cell wall biosynthesis